MDETRREEIVNEEDLLEALGHIDIEELYAEDTQVGGCSLCCSAYGGGKARYE